jgi:hypothetical protein
MSTIRWRGAFPVRVARRALVLACSGVLAACVDAPVDWTPAAPESAPAGARAVVVTAAGALRPDSLLQLADQVTPPAGGVCPGSLRLARNGRTLYAVWWSPRADSGARLLSAHSADDGASWGPPALVDTLDRGVSGCRRSPPAIAADAASGYVHVSYGLVAPEGTGLFFAHSMDGGATFHSPVAIVYGERLGRTSVAASGDLVAVAFEDPNSSIPRIGLALSLTMGHIFEHRVMPVSDDNGAASHPVVALAGRRIALAWEKRPAVLPYTTDPVLLVRTGLVH